MVRRELGSWRGGHGHTKAKSAGTKAMARANLDWNPSISASPWMNWQMTEPWGEFGERWPNSMWSPNWSAEWPLASAIESNSTLNDKGQLELKAMMPQGIAQEDIHLDFENGGLRLHASKSHESSRMLQGTKGSSTHKTHVSITHYWPLDASITEKDISAHFNDESHLLEITVNQPQILEERPKMTPIAIKAHTMLDQPKTVTDLLTDASHPSKAHITAEKAQEMADEAIQIAKHTKEATIDALKAAGSKAKEIRNEFSESAKGAVGSASKVASKKEKHTISTDEPQVPSMHDM